MKVSDGLLSMQWAILEDHLVRMDACDQEVKADSEGAGGRGASGYSVTGGIASVPLKGVIFQEWTFLTYLLSAIFGGTILSDFVAALQKADADPAVGGIVIDTNSPGGEALGIEAAAAVIASLGKPVTAFVDGMAASAAYWLVSAADQIMLSGETSQVGSIGTVLAMRDSREAEQKSGVKRHEIVSSQSPRKRPDPTTDAGLADLRSYVDQLAEVFITNVAANRETAVETVKAEFGQGAMILGTDAVARGMADGISSREAMLAGMRAGQYGLGGSAAKFSSKGLQSMKTPEELAAEKAAAEKAQADAVSAAKVAGITEGKTLERARFAAILGCEEAKGRPALALELATTTELEAEAAKKLLSKAALETKTESNPLADAMAKVPNPKVGAGGGGDLDEAGEVAAIVAAGKAARGEK